jgi:prolyl-tRNA synthetase
MEFAKKELKKKSDNISDWYNDVVLKAELADYGPVKGTMVIRPYGYAIWEHVQEIFNGMIKKAGVQNAYFPMFIPESYLKKEKAHVEGFSPELAIVTIGGGEKLAEPLVVRPTSETIMYAMYSKWIKSWRDLPLKLNQWCNVVRWEKRTYLFLRTTEFLWQEGHTAHSTHEDAILMANMASEWYRQIFEDYFAIPVMLGVKSINEQFAGAVTSQTVEALMPDGKALQSATSHDLGQNFSKVFDIAFQNQNKEREFVWQTSWGLSTRALGGLFLVHGDDNGLILPPKIAPHQVVIIPIYKKDQSVENLKQYGYKIQKQLSDMDKPVRAVFDHDENNSPGRKFNEWEVKGVPVRLEIGPQELADNTVTAVYRDTHEKKTLKLDELLKTIHPTFDQIQKRMFDRQKTFLTENTRNAADYGQFKEIMQTSKGFIRAFWCEDPECEKIIKNETKATTRCLPADKEDSAGVCVRCGKNAVHKWIFAQSY